MAGAYPGFCSMRQRRVLLLTPGWDASPSQDTQQYVVGTHNTPGWRETMWSKVSCLRKQYNGRDWASNHRPSDLKSNMLTTTVLCPHIAVYITAQK